MRDLSFNFHESSFFICLLVNPLNLLNWKFSLLKNHFAFILSRSNKINQSAVLHEKRIMVISCEDEALRKTTFNLSLTHLTANVSVKRRAMTVTSTMFGTRSTYLLTTSYLDFTGLWVISVLLQNVEDDLVTYMNTWIWTNGCLFSRIIIIRKISF